MLPSVLLEDWLAGRVNGSEFVEGETHRADDWTCEAVWRVASRRGLIPRIPVGRKYFLEKRGITYVSCDDGDRRFPQWSVEVSGGEPFTKIGRELKRPVYGEIGESDPFVLLKRGVEQELPGAEKRAREVEQERARALVTLKVKWAALSVAILIALLFVLDDYFGLVAINPFGVAIGDFIETGRVIREALNSYSPSE
ncbi:hypothetical protein [Actinomycetospora lemnae]|uniref:Uncharacterized protein n=1 Tax=Actinomycetospora lemnae TaxID=3019891 RepID=A0ABT5SW03_9PSEU|nr:hypothetical protein [Actinomycetospora sp. DW7H6]MDD7965898.1 hypothetical protein [Actinomycetospora sp. DW7H6]